MPTSSKNRRESGKSNGTPRSQRTDRLLDSVEQLIALHDKQDVPSQSPLELLERLDRFESQLDQLAQLQADLAKRPSIESFVKQLESALEKRFQSTEKRLAGHFSKQLQNIQSQSADQDELRQPLEAIQKQQEALQEQLEWLALQWEESRNPSAAEEAGTEPAATTAALEKLADQLDKVQASLAEREQPSPAADKSHADWQAQLESAQQQWASSVEAQFEQQLAPLRAKLDEVSDALASQSATDEEAPAERPTPGSTSELLAKFADQVNHRTAKLLEKFREELATANPAPTVAKSASGRSNANPPLAPSTDRSASHWERQKEAMLAKYGIDPNYRPTEASQASNDEPPASPPEKDSAAEKLESLHASIDKIAPEANPDIEKLKEELNSKLRDAEVELSIARAKLSRERAELEEARTELKQRTQELEAKLAKFGDGTSKGGFISRLGRHLGGERQTERPE